MNNYTPFMGQDWFRQMLMRRNQWNIPGLVQSGQLMGGGGNTFMPQGNGLLSFLMAVAGNGINQPVVNEQAQAGSPRG